MVTTILTVALTQPGHCLTVKPIDPSTMDGVDAVQIWAKPQPKGATAVLLINNAMDVISIPFEFKDVG